MNYEEEIRVKNEMGEVRGMYVSGGGEVERKEGGYMGGGEKNERKKKRGTLRSCHETCVDFDKICVFCDKCCVC